MKNLERQFLNEMLDTCEKAKELTPPYKPTGFKGMLNRHGGVGTAKILLAKKDYIHQGVIDLWERNALYLSMEASVIKPEYKELFTEQEISTAHRRLKELGYFG